MLTVCSSSTGTKFTTTAYVKSLLDVLDNENDALFDQLIESASEQIRNYCRQPFYRQQYSETIAGQGVRRLILSRTPVLSVSGVFYGTDTGTATEITSTEYRIEDADAGFLRRLSFDWLWTAGSYVDLEETAIPGSEYERYLVRYHAGYLTPPGSTSTAYGSTSTGATLPYDLQQAAAELTKEMYLRRQRSGAMKSKTVGDLSITYDLGDQSDGKGTALPNNVRSLLAPYVRSY